LVVINVGGNLGLPVLVSNPQFSLLMTEDAKPDRSSGPIRFDPKPIRFDKSKKNHNNTTKE